MKRHPIGPRWLAGLMATALAGASGCVGCLHPVAAIPDDLIARGAVFPQACRNHIYIFLIDGPDPFDMANLGGVREALLAQGYIKTYCGQYWHSGYFKDEILRLKREDESAHFVVLGFGLGASAARDLTEAVRPAGATVDLLAYCGGVALSNDPTSWPANASHVINILGQGIDGAGTSLDGADNFTYADAGHFDSPTHYYTMQVLSRELTEVASRVKVIDMHPSAAPMPEIGPSPRTAETREALPRDEWDFLKPTPAHPTQTAPAEMPKAK